MSSVRFLGDFEENFPLGLNVDVGVPLGATMFSVVGEFGWVRDSDEIGNRDVNVDLLNFGGGVRVSYRDVPNVVPFGQVHLWRPAEFGQPLRRKLDRLHVRR